eukprot:764581-Hanusia_phi.AAC.12
MIYANFFHGKLIYDNLRTCNNSLQDKTGIAFNQIFIGDWNIENHLVYHDPTKERYPPQSEIGGRHVYHFKLTQPEMVLLRQHHVTEHWKERHNTENARKALLRIMHDACKVSWAEHNMHINDIKESARGDKCLKWFTIACQIMRGQVCSCETGLDILVHIKTFTLRATKEVMFTNSQPKRIREPHGQGKYWNKKASDLPPGALQSRTKRARIMTDLELLAELACLCAVQDEYAGRVLPRGC